MIERKEVVVRILEWPDFEEVVVSLLKVRQLSSKHVLPRLKNSRIDAIKSWIV